MVYERRIISKREIRISLDCKVPRREGGLRRYNKDKRTTISTLKDRVGPYNDQGRVAVKLCELKIRGLPDRDFGILANGVLSDYRVGDAGIHLILKLHL